MKRREKNCGSVFSQGEGSVRYCQYVYLHSFYWQQDMRKGILICIYFSCLDTLPTAAFIIIECDVDAVLNFYMAVCFTYFYIWHKQLKEIHVCEPQSSRVWAHLGRESPGENLSSQQWQCVTKDVHIIADWESEPQTVSGRGWPSPVNLWHKWPISLVMP